MLVLARRVCRPEETLVQARRVSRAEVCHLFDQGQQHYWRMVCLRICM